MREVTLGKSGLRVPAVGFGGIPIQRLSPEESDRVLEEAIERGVRFFDNARIYTDSESKMGRVLPRYRDKIVLATKSFQREGAKVREDLETSLREQGPIGSTSTSVTISLQKLNWRGLWPRGEPLKPWSRPKKRERSSTSVSPGISLGSSPRR